MILIAITAVLVAIWCRGFVDSTGSSSTPPIRPRWSIAASKEPLEVVQQTTDRGTPDDEQLDLKRMSPGVAAKVATSLNPPQPEFVRSRADADWAAAAAPVDLDGPSSVAGKPIIASDGEPRFLQTWPARLPLARAGTSDRSLQSAVDLRPVSPAVRLAGFSASSNADAQGVAQPSGNAGLQYLPTPNPEILRAPQEPARPVESAPPPATEPDSLLQYSRLPPSGFTGPSGILPREEQENSHFVPLEDRWRSGFPEWDRYGRGHPLLDDYPYAEGNKWNSYKQNVLKGDYPIVGQHTFLSITATSQSIVEFRQVPTATTPFESTTNPNQNDFFGKPNQFFYTHNFSFSVDLSHGDAAFKPADWRIRLTPVFNLNDLSVQELGVVSPDVTQGTSRFRTDFALQEWFAETKLADLSPDYDFVSLRAGSQQFNSDFRGFVFSDTNRAVRLFGTRLANRDQFNMIYFDQTEKDTNSFLNTFADRHQNTLIMNYYRQDFIFPGYTSQVSFHYNHDKGSFHYDDNGFLVRPDPAGVALPHSVNSYYLGWTGDGHINRFNINHAFYQVFGRDTLNPLAGQPVQINAQMAALELSYDRDWVRFRSSLFYASGDHNINDNKARGFDAILDNPNFAGGQFSYWQRQSVKLLGVNLVNRMSLVPDLRSSKLEGQSNFVNPGLELVNAGMDFEVTPRTRLISNVNFLWFDSTNVLQQFVFQENIRRNIGVDLSLGTEYRPFLNNRAILIAGVSGLIPGQGFKDLYNPIVGNVPALFASFIDLSLSY